MSRIVGKERGFQWRDHSSRYTDHSHVSAHALRLRQMQSASYCSFAASLQTRTQTPLDRRYYQGFIKNPRYTNTRSFQLQYLGQIVWPVYQIQALNYLLLGASDFYSLRSFRRSCSILVNNNHCNGFVTKLGSMSWQINYYSVIDTPKWLIKKCTYRIQYKGEDHSNLDECL